jgi:hypothetical protein
MPARAIIPAAIVTAPTPDRRHIVQSSYPHDQAAGPSRSYGAITTSSHSSPGSRKGKEPAVGFDLEDGHEACDSESCQSDDGDMEPLVDSKLKIPASGDKADGQ